MQTKRLEHEIGMAAYKKQQKEMQALVARMLGNHGEPKSPLKERRREIAQQLGGISVSKTNIEAR